MYKILIVDDASIELECISFLIEQFHFPLHKKLAANGKKAIELLETEHFDILFTDIKMPYVDGLALSKRALTLQPHLKIIIFSGYGEFEYAKSALQLGVSDYLLKPIDPDEFVKIITSTLATLKQEHRQLESTLQQQEVLKQHALLLLVSGIPVESLGANLTTAVPAHCFSHLTQLALLEFSSEFFCRKNTRFNDFLAEELPFPFDYINLNSTQSVLLISEQAYFPDVFRSFSRMLLRLKAVYNEKGFVAVVPCNSEHALGNALEQAEKHMEKRFFYSDTQLFFPLTQGETQSPSPTISIEAIKESLRLKEYSVLHTQLPLLFRQLEEDKQYSQLYVKFLFSSLLHEISHQLPRDCDFPVSEMIEKIYALHHLDQLVALLMKAVQLLELKVPAIAIAASRVETIKHYVYENYHKSLALSQLANEIYVHPDYLCRIFKKETGSNLSKFIKTHRMQKAKELLHTTHKRVREISEAVGYQNYSYFCQSYREFYGVTPEQSREGVAMP